MAVYVKYQNVYRIVVDDNNNVISLPISVVVDFLDLEALTNVVKLQIYVLQHLLPYSDDSIAIEEVINNSWCISSEEFNLLIEKMLMPHIEGTKFENVLTKITRLINSCKLTCADYLSDFNEAYSLIFFDYNAKRDEVCKIMIHLRQILRQDANIMDLHGLQHISMMLQRLVTLMRKPYIIYAAAVTVLFHLPLLMGYPAIRIECTELELNHISIVDVIANMVLISVHEALIEEADEFMRIFINRKLGHVHNLDSLHHWYQHLLTIDRNCVKKYILSMEKYLSEQQITNNDDDDEFLTKDDDDNVTFNSNGWRILALLTRDDRQFILMHKRVLDSVNISLTSFLSIWFTSHSMLLHLPQSKVSNLSYTVTIRRMLKKILKMSGYRSKNGCETRFNYLVIYKFINDITNSIINMRLFNHDDVIELLNIYNRHPIVVEIMEFLLEMTPQSMGKMLSSAAKKVAAYRVIK